MCRTLDGYGCDGPALMRDAGLDPRLMDEPDARYPEAQMQVFWRLAVEATGDDCFGLHMAEALQPAALHGLGFSWLASHTLRDGLVRVVRYARIVSTAIDVHLEEDKDTVRVVSTEPELPQPPVAASSDSEPAGFLQMCRITAGEPLAPVRVALTRASPAAPCDREFQRFFQAPIDFSSAANALVFDRAKLDQPLPYRNPELARVNDEVVIDYLARFDRENVVLQVRSQIIDQLPSGELNQDDVARSLHMSLRNMQRRLRDQDTSFKALLDGTRQDLATQYLKASHRTIGEISYLLGFSEPANFARAFKRWIGMTPQEFRRSP